VVPAFLTTCCGMWTFYYTDDTPRGNLSELRTKDSIVGQLIGREDDAETNGNFGQMFVDFFRVLKNPNVILLMMQVRCAAEPCLSCC
jgi:hypothetical protein